MQLWQTNSIRISRKILSDYLILPLIFLAEASGYLSNLSLDSCKLWRPEDSEKDLSISGPLSPRHERNLYEDTNTSDKFTFWSNRTIFLPKNTILTPWSSFVDSWLSLKNLWASEEWRTLWRLKIWIWVLEFSFHLIHSSTCSWNSRESKWLNHLIHSPKDQCSCSCTD